MKKISLLLAVFLIVVSVNLSFAFADSIQLAALDKSALKVTVNQKENGAIHIGWDCPKTDLTDINLIIFRGAIMVINKSLGLDTWEYDYINGEDGEDYTIMVAAYYKDGTSISQNIYYTFSNNKSIPQAPSGLAAKIESNGDVTLTWKSNSVYEMGFQIAKEDGNGDGGVITLNTIGQESYVDNVAHTAGMTYKYKVKSYNSYGASDYSNEVSVTFPEAASTAPSNCTAKLQSDESIKVTWNDNSNWETGFTIVRTDGNGKNKFLDVAADVTSYTDTEKLTAGMTYVYKVSAHDDNGQSDYSNQVSVTIPTVVLTAPAAPSDLSAKQNHDKITLTWKDNSDNETGFTITRTDDKSKISTTATVLAETKSYTDGQGISAGTTYTYTLKAFNATGNSSEVKVSISATNSVANTDFTFDGTESSWAKSEIIQAYEDGLTYYGVLSNFNRNITREEFCTIVVKLYERLSGKKTVSYDNPFTDVVSDDVVKAFRLGIVKGTSATTFSPDNKITRQEICVMIARCLEASVSGIKINSNSNLSFDDNNQIASWAKESMGYCYSVGIMNGVGNNRIAPLSNTTREQAIALIERTFQEYK